MKLLGSIMCIISAGALLAILHDFLLIISLYDAGLSEWLSGAQFAQYYLSGQPFTLVYYGLAAGLVFVLGCALFVRRKMPRVHDDPYDPHAKF